MMEVAIGIVLVGMLFLFYKGMQFLENFLRRLIDKIRKVTPAKRAEINEQKDIDDELIKLKEIKQKEGIINQRKEIEERLEKSQFGKTFEAWAGLAWFIFIVFILIKLIGYFDASDKRMEALWKSNGYYQNN